MLTEWQADGYNIRENNCIERVEDEVVLVKDTCTLIIRLYHVGNDVDFPHFPDGSWHEIEITNFANVSNTITNITRFNVEADTFRNLLTFAAQGLSVMDKFAANLKAMGE